MRKICDHARPLALCAVALWMAACARGLHGPTAPAGAPDPRVTPRMGKIDTLRVCPDGIVRSGACPPFCATTPQGEANGPCAP